MQCEYGCLICQISTSNWIRHKKSFESIEERSIRIFHAAAGATAITDATVASSNSCRSKRNGGNISIRCSNSRWWIWKCSLKSRRWNLISVLGCLSIQARIESNWTSIGFTQQAVEFNGDILTLQPFMDYKQIIKEF